MTILPFRSAAQVKHRDFTYDEHRILNLQIRFSEIERELPILIADAYDFDGRLTGDSAAVLALQVERSHILGALAAFAESRS